MPTKGDLTKQRILTIARELFYSKGFDATSTAEIARGANVSEATMYKYYKSKKELLIASIQPTYIVEDLADCSHFTNAELIEHWMETFFKKVENNLQQYIILFSESVKYPEASESYLKLFHQVLESDVELEKRVAKGLLPNVDITILKVGIIGALIAMLQHMIIYKQLDELTTIPQNIKDLVRDLINGRLVNA
ncbi:TetR/AcrR family transcriptional regulator [Kurthia senegalensis]|uniref:TetR/AcrR family transcriptional regulator n=1 Tax=Kurthia senegalensis TaxID=1033740 RepID=UPI000288FB20|nr:TetR/AcrR family transcriptional regulator [Kurthia senegalensis]